MLTILIIFYNFDNYDNFDIYENYWQFLTIVDNKKTTTETKTMTKTILGPVIFETLITITTI